MLRFYLRIRFFARVNSQVSFQILSLPEIFVATVKITYKRLDVAVNFHVISQVLVIGKHFITDVARIHGSLKKKAFMINSAKISA